MRHSRYFAVIMIAMVMMMGASLPSWAGMYAQNYDDKQITGSLKAGGVGLEISGDDCQIPDTIMAPGDTVTVVCEVTNSGNLAQQQYVYAEGVDEPLCSQFTYVIRDVDQSANLYTGQLSTDLATLVNKKAVNNGDVVVVAGGTSVVQIDLTLTENLPGGSQNTSCDLIMIFYGQLVV